MNEKAMTFSSYMMALYGSESPHSRTLRSPDRWGAVQYTRHVEGGFRCLVIHVTDVANILNSLAPLATRSMHLFEASTIVQSDVRLA